MNRYFLKSILLIGLTVPFLSVSVPSADSQEMPGQSFSIAGQTSTGCIQKKFKSQIWMPVSKYDSLPSYVRGCEYVYAGRSGYNKKGVKFHRVDFYNVEYYQTSSS